MLRLSQRYTVLAALLFWQGGFTFYASVVVPVGQQVLASHRRQGAITRKVTNYLNLAGAVALVPLAGDLVATRDPSARRRRLRWWTWFGMLLTLAGLVGLHMRLDELLTESSGASPFDDDSFHTAHRFYLWVSTVQWMCALVYAGLTLQAWQAVDRATAGMRASGVTRGEDGDRLGA
jgi:Na+-driven multidrug efflux pump